MEAAQQGEVLKCGRPAVVPRDDVVNVAPVPGPVASRELAVFVTQPQGPPLVGRDVGNW